MKSFTPCSFRDRSSYLISFSKFTFKINKVLINSYGFYFLLFYDIYLFFFGAFIAYVFPLLRSICIYLILIKMMFHFFPPPRYIFVWSSLIQILLFYPFRYIWYQIFDIQPFIFLLKAFEHAAFPQSVSIMILSLT